MKLNKTIIIGLLFIVFAGVIFITDIFNPIVRPITHIFLMGSSKGKDILFFGLLGLFLILSQIKLDIDMNKYLKFSIVIGWITLIFGIILEVAFRLQMGIKLNSVFCSMTSMMSSTSILHTHLIKSILGKAITQIMGPFVQSGINTGVGLYQYVPSFGFLAIILISILTITLILSMQNRPWFTNLITAFSACCLIVGAFDGGMFGTPAIVGIFGLLFVYEFEFDINHTIALLLKDDDLLKQNGELYPSQKYEYFWRKKLTFKDLRFYIMIILFLVLRFSIAFAGAETDHYTVNIEGISDNVDFGDIPIEKIDNRTYTVPSSYIEMDLINDLKIPLNNSCEYYTVSWNMYSYF